MAEASIPVDPFNPGQVFACLGFLEASEVLCGDAGGWFDWRDPTNARFHVRAKSIANPIEDVLSYLAGAQLQVVRPMTGVMTDVSVSEEDSGSDEGSEDRQGIEESGNPSSTLSSEVFPAKAGDVTTFPVRLWMEGRPCIELNHWIDGSSRERFKLYSGNRSAFGIASAMLRGTNKTKGVMQLWREDQKGLVKDPFNKLTPLGGSFNFDPRGAWTAMDLGYSPNTLRYSVESSPIVEILASWGLQNARPVIYGVRQVRYAVWGVPLHPEIARIALSGYLTSIPLRSFHFDLALSGKNKVVTFSEEEF